VCKSVGGNGRMKSCVSCRPATHQTGLLTGRSSRVRRASGWRGIAFGLKETAWRYF
jgi:hypothetical protein